MRQTLEIEEFFAELEKLDRMVLVELAECGRGLPLPPAFRGRCLDPAYLEAVAAAQWSLDDESLLASVDARLEAGPLAKVRRMDRRGLRSVLRGAALAVLTRHLTIAGWEVDRQALTKTWEGVVGPLPAATVPVPALVPAAAQ